MGDMSVVTVGIDGGMQQHKNLLLRTRTLPLLCPDKVALVWVDVCDCSVDDPLFCFMVL